MRAQILASIMKDTDFDNVRSVIPQSFISRYDKPYLGMVPKPEDYSQDESDIKLMYDWRYDPIGDLPDRLKAFQKACTAHEELRRTHYSAYDKIILKKYLDYLVDTLI
jgi:hypothetical protein